MPASTFPISDVSYLNCLYHCFTAYTTIRNAEQFELLTSHTI